MSAIKKIFQQRALDVKLQRIRDIDDLRTAQHYVVCDNCEEEPAEFLCKTCPGHLCQNCKSEHEKKKITRNHEIVSLTSNNDDISDLLYCTDHNNKKLECYCNPCEKPVCTECIVNAHNGHSVKLLSTVLNEMKAKTRFHKDEVENMLIPKYKELLAIEDEKRSEINKIADDIENEIELHTQNLLRIVKSTGKKYVQQLQMEKNVGLGEIEISKTKIQDKLQRLQQIDELLSANLRAKPSDLIFKPVDVDELESLRTLPVQTDIKLSNFEPGDISQFIEENFGVSQNVQQTRKVAACRGYVYNQTSARPGKGYPRIKPPAYNRLISRNARRYDD